MPDPSGDPTTLGNDEIEKLLASTAAAARPAQSAAAPADPGIAPADVDFLLSQAQAALASVDAPSERGPLPGISPFRWEELGAAAASTEMATLDLLRDVELELTIELGRTQMLLEDVLKLRKGSVVPLDKLAGDPVDIYVNGRLIARGEVLVLSDNFCVRVAELITSQPTLAE
jgi:flagellar motor switch protein FliN/FliY